MPSVTFKVIYTLDTMHLLSLFPTVWSTFGSLQLWYRSVPIAKLFLPLVSGSYPYQQLSSHVMTLIKKFGLLAITFFQVLAQIQLNGLFYPVWESEEQILRQNVSFANPRQNPQARAPTHACLFWNFVDREMQSSLIFWRIFSTFSSFRDVEWRPERAWSSILISPRLKEPKPF